MTSKTHHNYDGTVTVIFRADGPKANPNITAVFPTDPGDTHGRYMSCYSHIGQHSACGMEWYRATRLATPQEYAPLLRELQSYGSADDKPYAKLRIAKRITPAMRECLKMVALAFRTKVEA